jgi:presequence protease
MLGFDGFELLREQALIEFNTTARSYRHAKTGAELLSLVNDDENKVFAVTFRTPPRDSTGVPISSSTPCFAARASIR